MGSLTGMNTGGGQSSTGFFRNPRQFMSGGPANGMYSAQRNVQTTNGFAGANNFGIPGVNFNLTPNDRGGPQPGRPIGSTVPGPINQPTNVRGQGVFTAAGSAPQGYGYSWQDQFPGLDPSKFPLGTTFRDLLGSGAITKDQLYSSFGFAPGYDPAQDKGLQDSYTQYLRSGELMANQGAPQTTLSFDDWYNQFGLPNTSFSSYSPQGQYDPGAYTAPGAVPGQYSSNVNVPGVGGGGPAQSYNPGGVGYNPGSIYQDPTQTFLGNLSLGNIVNSGSATAPTGIRQLSSSLLNGDIYGVPASSSDYSNLRNVLQSYLVNNFGGLNAQSPNLPGRVDLGTSPNASDAGVGIQSSDQLGGANSDFFKNMYAQYAPAFTQERNQAIAQAKEGAGNLVGSGYANAVGNAINKSLASEQATIAGLINQQITNEQQRQGTLAQLAQGRNLANQSLAGQYGLNQGSLDQARNLGIYDTQSNLANANAGRLSGLFGQLGTAGVSPDEIVSQGGLGAILGPLLGALGNSSLGSGLASGLGNLAGGLTSGLGNLAGGIGTGLGNLGGGLVSGLGNLAGGLGNLGGSIAGGLGNLGGSLVSGLGNLAGGLGNLGGSLAGGLSNLAGGLASQGSQAIQGLYEAVKSSIGDLAKNIDVGGLIQTIGNLPGIDKIIGSIASGAGGNIQPIIDALKNIPAFKDLQSGDVYNILKALAKYGIIRGTGGQIINGLPNGQPTGGGGGSYFPGGTPPWSPASGYNGPRYG